MAFGLAVYASQGGLPHHHARLASGRWSGATGRAFTRRLPTKGFKAASYIFSSFPKLTWRNHIDRRIESSQPGGKSESVLRGQKVSQGTEEPDSSGANIRCV
jgi:hypothetical protein